MRSGCMRLNHTGVSYKFQMSAVSVVGGELLEGSLSDITALTILYVPQPGRTQTRYHSTQQKNLSIFFTAMDRILELS